MRAMILFGIAALVACQVYYIVSGLRRNINKVKSSGLPYVIARKILRSLSYASLTDLTLS